MSSAGDVDAMRHDVQASWHRFLDAFEPLRPELYRYCRCLTRSAWDAEDLAQDTLMRAFVTLGTVFRDLPNPRAWLFRVASNLWVDRARRGRFELAIEPRPEPAATVDPRDAREAASAVLVRLSPQERAAVVLKDVFDFTLEEVAEALSTTPGAVKAALHRGRGKLVESTEPEARAPAPGVLDAFTAAFNARDLEGLTALLLDHATVEIVGLVTEYGRDAPKDPETGSFAGSLTPITHDERGGVRAELLEGYLGTAPRCEVRAYRGERILVFWFEHVDGPAVRSVFRVDVDGGEIRRLQNYFFTPEVLAEICTELGLPFRTNGYAYWHS